MAGGIFARQFPHKETPSLLQPKQYLGKRKSRNVLKSRFSKRIEMRYNIYDSNKETMTNFLKNLLNKAKLPMSAPSGSVVGIDIGSSSIKAVQLKKEKGKAVLETYGELSLGSYADSPVGSLTNLSAEVLAQALKDVLKESQVTASDVALALPSASSLVFVLELPGSISEKDLKEVVPIEARRYIPVPLTEVTLDWWTIPQREEASTPEGVGVSTVSVGKKTEVLVAAIHNDTLSKYREIVERTGLSGGLFEIEIFSNIRSTLGWDLSSALLVDFGASKTKLSIVESGILRKSHIIARGGADITGNLATALDVPFARAEALKKEFGLLGIGTNKNVADVSALVIDYIFSEANEVLLNYERANNKTINKVVLTGGGALLKGLLEKARENFKIEAVIADPFNKAETPEFLKKVLQSVGPPFGVAIGLALKKIQ